MNPNKTPRGLLRISYGLCPECGEDDCAPGGLRCVKCRDKQNARHRETYPERKLLRNAAWYERKAKETRERRAAHKGSGRCIGCRKPVRRFQRCPACRKSAAEAKRRYRQKGLNDATPEGAVSHPRERA